ncbi:hypothetical protein K9M79_00730 [Candidatus Woesearchaeota archaeon]|nr:hypothetical protein [Candidatus Woesearchaeota archaeon]
MVGKTFRRKLVRQGRNALTITLPSEWTKQNKLSQGCEVELTLSDVGLTIGTFQPEKNEIAVTLSTDNEKYISHVIRNMYYIGYTRISLTLRKKSINAISKVVSRCMGYEIVEQSNSHCIISMVSSPKEYATVEKRLFTLMQSFLRIVSDDMNKRDLDIQKTSDIVHNIIRYASYCRRLASDSGSCGKKESVLRNIIYLRISHIAGNVKYLIENMTKSDGTERKKTLDRTTEIFDMITSGFDQVYKGFFNHDPKAIESMYDITERCFDQLGRKTSYYLRDIVRSLEGVGAVVYVYALQKTSAGK